MRAGGVREDAVSRTTDTLRQAAAATAVSAHHLGSGHRAALLRPPRRQDAHRDTHQRYAAQRRLIQLAVHVRSVAERARSRLIVLREMDRNKQSTVQQCLNRQRGNFGV